MRLGRKNLWYSMALAGAMLLFLVGYFIVMLPSLYVDYVMEQNLHSIRMQHRAYVETGSYEGVKVKNSTACMSVKIPEEGNTLIVTGKSYSAEITLQDVRLQRFLDGFRAYFRQTEQEETFRPEWDPEILEGLWDVVRETFSGNESLPVSLKWLYLKEGKGEFFGESTKIHTYLDGVIVVESSIEDSENQYTNYMAMERNDDGLVLSVLPVVAPEVDEIRPVVLQSLPMLGAVILLAVLIFSQAYSSGIVNPIVKLVRHTEEMKASGQWGVCREERQICRREKRDEVQELEDTLDDLYRQIQESLRDLEEKNRELAEENLRQEVFLRASSHQLKTPVAAALLLVDGMINEIGRYRETRVYLPKVKELLLSMRKMVEDILYLNQCARNMTFRQTDVGKVLQEKMSGCQVAIADRRLTVEIGEEDGFSVRTDEAMLGQILDNLLSNAVKYTPPGGRIRISLGQGPEGRGVKIENFGTKIPEEIAAHVFEPFVSGCHDKDKTVTGSHGLGLYIASYYAKKLGFSLRVDNEEDSVVSILLL